MTKLPVLLALGLAAGCATDGVPESHGEPGLPRALGTLTLGASVDTTAWTRLELRFAPVEGEDWWTYEQTFELASTTLPLSYAIGGDIGTNPNPQWRLDAWLTNTAETEAPADGEPVATRLLEFPCGDGCPTQAGIDLVVQ